MTLIVQIQGTSHQLLSKGNQYHSSEKGRISKVEYDSLIENNNIEAIAMTGSNTPISKIDVSLLRLMAKI